MKSAFLCFVENRTQFNRILPWVRLESNIYFDIYDTFETAAPFLTKWEKKFYSVFVNMGKFGESSQLEESRLIEATCIKLL